MHKKIAGLPAGVWLLIIVAGVGVGVYVRKRAEQTQPSDTTGTDSTGADTGSTSADTMPYDSLPSEDYGNYPMTGGGPPSVYGDTALRLTPDTLRIKLEYPKRHRHQGGHHAHHGGHHKHHH
jgi:hypothetical protein